MEPSSSVVIPRALNRECRFQHRLVDAGRGRELAGAFTGQTRELSLLIGFRILHTRGTNQDWFLLAGAHD